MSSQELEDLRRTIRMVASWVMGTHEQLGLLTSIVSEELEFDPTDEYVMKLEETSRDLHRHMKESWPDLYAEIWPKSVSETFDKGETEV